MKPLLLTLGLSLPLLLCQCGGFQYIAYHETGAPKHVVQTDGLLDEAEGTAKSITMPDGTVLSSVVSHPNRTRVADSLIGAGVTKVGIREWGKSDRITRTADGAAKVKGTDDPDFVPDDPENIPADPNLPKP